MGDESTGNILSYSHITSYKLLMKVLMNSECFNLNVLIQNGFKKPKCLGINKNNGFIEFYKICTYISYIS